jgi:hypothetical protein
MYAYKGGIMVEDPADPYSYINVGGILLGSHNFSTINILTYNYSCTSTDCLGTYSYEFNTGRFKRDATCPNLATPAPTRSPLPTPTPIYCCDSNQVCSYSPSIDVNTLGSINIVSRTPTGSIINTDKLECSNEVIQLLYSQSNGISKLLNVLNLNDLTKTPEFNTFYYRFHKLYYVKQSHPDGRVFPTIQGIARRTDGIPVGSLINVANFTDISTASVRNWIRTNFKFTLFKNNSSNTLEYVDTYRHTNIIWKPGDFIRQSPTFIPQADTVYGLLYPY